MPAARASLASEEKQLAPELPVTLRLASQPPGTRESDVALLAMSLPRRLRPRATRRTADEGRGAQVARTGA
jgi:hypothetical protein